MVYTKKSPALLIIGLIMLAIWYLADSGMMMPYLDHLALGKKYKYLSELTSIPLYFGIIALAVGLWQWFGTHKEGNVDYYLSSIPGGMFILLIAMLVRWFVAPEIHVISVSFGKSVKPAPTLISYWA